LCTFILRLFFKERYMNITCILNVGNKCLVFNFYTYLKFTFTDYSVGNIYHSQNVSASNNYLCIFIVRWSLKNETQTWICILNRSNKYLCIFSAPWFSLSRSETWTWYSFCAQFFKRMRNSVIVIYSIFRWSFKSGRVFYKL
jgi:hypothetical protein